MLIISKKEILHRVFLLEFETQYDLTATFLRFQEYYESPEFRGKIFTLDEFIKWYSRDTGKFTYYEDWNGFNIPSWVLKPFYEGKFNPLSEKEKQLLDMFKNKNYEFYIIATHRNAGNKLMLHEIAHALFYTIPEYRKEVLEILSKYDISEIISELKKKDGYHDDVILDEVHAWILHSSDKLNSEINASLKSDLDKLFHTFFKNHSS